MAKKSDKQLYWLGPGSYGFGKNKLNPGDPIPSDFPEVNLKRFKKRIGEKVVSQVSLNQQEKIKNLAAENAALKEELEERKAEINKLINQIESPDGKK